MSRDSNSGSNLVFFLLGAAVGAAVALLYAPQEGEATRRLLGEKATDARDKVSELALNTKQTAAEKWDTVSHSVSDAVSNTKQTLATKLQRGQHAAHEAIDNAADNAHNAVESV